MADHTCTEKINGDSIYFCGHPSRARNHYDTQDRRKFLNKVKNFYWDDPYLFKYCPDQIFQRCVLENEIRSVIKFCHSDACGGHFSSKKTVGSLGIG